MKTYYINRYNEINSHLIFVTNDINEAYAVYNNEVERLKRVGKTEEQLPTKPTFSQAISSIACELISVDTDIFNAHDLEDLWRFGAENIESSDFYFC